MNNTQGTFIVIEGTDGSGKGTQFKLLAERLQNAGYDVALFDFPQYDNPSSYFVRQYLNGQYGNADSVGPYTGSLFYALDRFEAAKAIRTALDQGKVVLANRFVGSNMAHQGTKFINAEERRGYFIWLDNLEFEMLRIPRPTASFVLRVPAHIAQNLVDQKETRSYTDKKRDIHEANLSHLERSVQVYDEMCELFPRDFISIDCVRNNRLMDIDHIQRVLWEKIDPMLPPPAQLEMSNPAPVTDHKQNVQEAEVVDTTSTQDQQSEQQAQKQPDFIFEDASQLLLQALEDDESLDVTLVPRSSNNRYFIPSEFNQEIKKYYAAALDKIYETHDYIIETLSIFIAQLPHNASVPAQQRQQSARQNAAYIAQAVLPLAALSKAVVHVKPNITTSGAALQQSSLPELQAAVEHIITNYKPNTATTRVAEIASELLSENYANDTQVAQLVDYTPRNEMNVVADMLYQFSSLPLTEVQQASQAIPYAKKISIVEAYLQQDTNQLHALEAVHYTWDLLDSFQTFRLLQGAGVMRDASNIQWQHVTPRYGYDVPQIIEQAGLADYFEACFDISLRLHSYLQSAGFTTQAAYATLLGHRMRWTMTQNAVETFAFLKRHANIAPNVATAMHAKLSEVHPMLISYA